MNRKEKEILENRQKVADAIEKMTDYGDYSKDADEVQAKQALIDFFETLEQLPEEESVDYERWLYSGGLPIAGCGYFSFFANLLPFADALRKHRYALAIFEVDSLGFGEHLLQSRIRRALLSLYHNFLEDKENAQTK